MCVPAAQAPVSEDLEDLESEWNDENADDAENATPPRQLMPPVNQPDTAVRYQTSVSLLQALLRLCLCAPHTTSEVHPAADCVSHLDLGTLRAVPGCGMHAG